MYWKDTNYCYSVLVLLLMNIGTDDKCLCLLPIMWFALSNQRYDCVNTTGNRGTRNLWEAKEDQGLGSSRRINVKAMQFCKTHLHYLWLLHDSTQEAINLVENNYHLKCKNPYKISKEKFDTNMYGDYSWTYNTKCVDWWIKKAVYDKQWDSSKWICERGIRAVF